ncbi:hypothetical protein KCP70_20110 [Salmonella enterica subsp. enterica]|nr:hypothetical protein KCP70_20110 [Salmonella enterica subsp. enterica]
MMHPAQAAIMLLVSLLLLWLAMQRSSSRYCRRRLASGRFAVQHPGAGTAPTRRGASLAHHDAGSGRAVKYFNCAPDVHAGQRGIEAALPRRRAFDGAEPSAVDMGCRRGAGAFHKVA